MIKEGLLKMYRDLQCDDDFSTEYVNLNYYSVINDEVISLCVSNKVSASEINDRCFECFDIVLNSTGKLIGGISFDYYKPNSEFGNVTIVSVIKPSA